MKPNILVFLKCTVKVLVKQLIVGHMYLWEAFPWLLLRLNCGTFRPNEIVRVHEYKKIWGTSGKWVSFQQSTRLLTCSYAKNKPLFTIESSHCTEKWLSGMACSKRQVPAWNQSMDASKEQRVKDPKKLSESWI